MAQLLRQQMLLTQSMVDSSVTYSDREQVQSLHCLELQGPVPQAQVAQEALLDKEVKRLTMDTKWIPAAPLARLEVLEYNRSKELVWFQGLVRQVCIVAVSCPR